MFTIKGKALHLYHTLDSKGTIFISILNTGKRSFQLQVNNDKPHIGKVIMIVQFEIHECTTM
jgi:hypothetical protein